MQYIPCWATFVWKKTSHNDLTTICCMFVEISCVLFLFFVDCRFPGFFLTMHWPVEAAMKKIEDNNTLVFIVDRRANKPQVKAAVQRLYNVKVVSVNSLITPEGKKKAFVRLSADSDALDVANKVLTLNFFLQMFSEFLLFSRLNICFDLNLFSFFSSLLFRLALSKCNGNCRTWIKQNVCIFRIFLSFELKNWRQWTHLFLFLVYPFRSSCW